MRRRIRIEDKLFFNFYIIFIISLFVITYRATICVHSLTGDLVEAPPPPTVLAHCSRLQDHLTALILLTVFVDRRLLTHVLTRTRLIYADQQCYL